MKFGETYTLKVANDCTKSKSIEMRIFLDGTGQLRINMKHSQIPPKADMVLVPQKEDSGITLDLVPFYRFVAILEQIRDELFFEEEDVENFVGG
jgi:hypothetical protein